MLLVLKILIQHHVKIKGCKAQKTAPFAGLFYFNHFSIYCAHSHVLKKDPVVLVPSSQMKGSELDARTTTGKQAGCAIGFQAKLKNNKSEKYNTFSCCLMV